MSTKTIIQRFREKYRKGGDYLYLSDNKNKCFVSVPDEVEDFLLTEIKREKMEMLERISEKSYKMLCDIIKSEKLKL